MARDWNFPSNNFGTINGIGEAGIETFKGSPYRSLAREICQNSLDAVVDKHKPVIVEFASSFVTEKQLPGYKKLKSALYSALNFWTKQNNKKTVDFFKSATKIAELDKIPILRISDYNTTGLTGSDELYNTPWQNLVKSSGVSDKGGSSGGSFGIGKSAPFACSSLRTVFYSTLDIKGLKAYQGIARLVSFPERNIFSKDGDRMTTGIGYYGETKKNSPVTDCLTFDSTFNRSFTGTDVFIIGFMNKKGWENEIIKAVLDDFLVAVYNGYLVVKVNNIEISQNTLADMIEQYKDDVKTAYNYYSVLVSPETHVEKINFSDLGNMELHILIKNNLHRKVYMSRSNGMKVFDQKNISGSIHFSGICILKDENINSFFREMENPPHNAWEPERHSDVKAAKAEKKKLYQYIKSVVMDCGKTVSVDEVDAEGMGEFLPDEQTIGSGEDKRDAITDKTKEINIDISIQRNTQRGFEKTQSITGAEEDVMGNPEDLAYGDLGGKNYNDDGKNQSRIGTGFGGAEGDNPGKNGEGENQFDLGSPDDSSANIVRRRFSISVMSVRLFSTDADNHSYRLIFIPKKTAPNGCLQLSLSGEQKNADMNVVSASYTGSDKPLRFKNNSIYLSDIQVNKKIALDFSIDYAERCSMEVALYGYKI